MSLKVCRSGSLPGQAETADAALVVIDDQALQHVVDLIEGNRELEGGVALDRRLVLEVAEAARRRASRA
jgi:hypothetical protein